jgi:DNA repair and recombination RAD54-like protein
MLTVLPFLARCFPFFVRTLQSIAVVAAWYRTKRAHSHIVVCPSSLVRNWENEFDKWLGKVGQPRRIVIRMGGQDGLHQIRCFAENQSSTKSNRVGQVLIISYDLFRMHTTVIRQAMAGSIGILLVDEGHRLKNTAGSQTMTALESLQADSRLLISASPVQNNLSEFFSLVNFVRPGMLGELSAFRRDFERPIVAANRKNASPAARDLAFRQSRHLEALTKSTILRRLQADILARTLPPRTEILLFCKLSAEQIRLYQSATTSRAPNMAFAESLEILTNLRKVCTHPLLLGGNGEATLSSSGKLEVLSSLLVEMRRSADNNKVVVVSNFTSALSLIEELILKPNNMTYLRLDGNVPAQKRQEIVDMFNKTSASRSFCFLLSAKAGGCGLNLVGANNLVLFEPDWNPSVSTKQCTETIYPRYFFARSQLSSLVLYANPCTDFIALQLYVDGSTMHGPCLSHWTKAPDHNLSPLLDRNAGRDYLPATASQGRVGEHYCRRTRRAESRFFFRRIEGMHDAETSYIVGHQGQDWRLVA